MLHDGAVGTVDNGVILGVLQQDAHNGGFRNVGVQLAGDAQVLRSLQHIAGEAGTVVVVGVQQAAGLQIGGQVDRRPRRQIAALAVTADAEGQTGA